MKLAFIGGSLLGAIDGLPEAMDENLHTPFGQPSDSYLTGDMNGLDVVYINRHGRLHTIAPHQINYRANMFGLKMLEVTHIIAVTAVGGITDKMSPMRWVIPDQIIDYTYGRMQTYNDGDENEVNHIDFSYPFNDDLRKRLQNSVEGNNHECIMQATYGATQGPRLETIAEINKMERDGCDIVGMTAMPEAALARELEMDYATLSLVVNWDAGKSPGKDSHHQPSDIVSMDDIKLRIADGNKVLAKIIKNLAM